MPNRITVMITTVVVAWTSRLLGKVTFRISLRTSVRKLLVRAGNPVNLFPWSSCAIVIALAMVSAFLTFPDGLLPDSCFLLQNWQGRRDSNPQVRFWRPAV